MKGILMAAALAAGLSINVTLVPDAAAQDAAANYPTRPVRWIVPFSPGASNDITARLLAQKMTEIMGQQFVVDNRPGAGGSIGGKLVADAAPDGYTLLHANPGPSIYNVLIRNKPPYRMDDLTPVMLIGYMPLIIVASPKFTPNTPKQLVAYARANPGKLTWASAGNGSNLQVGLALFQAATDTDVLDIPYKGTAPALIDIISGRVNVMYTTTVSGGAHIKAGQIKVIGVAAPKRQVVIPNVPTLAEEGIKNAEAAVWFGVQVPAKTPRAIIAKLNAGLNKALAMSDVQAKLDQLGLVAVGGSSDEFAAFIKGEVDRFRMLIKTKRVDMFN